MVRTNIVIDEDLVTEVMAAYGLASRRAAVDFALRAVLPRARDGVTGGSAALALEGTWASVDDDELRRVYGEDWWGG